jgi:hypothetical protein
VSTWLLLRLHCPFCSSLPRSHVSCAPSATSISNRHLLFALSGQRADLSVAATASLTFSPKLVCASASSDTNGGGYELPVLLPGVVGVISCKASQYSLKLTVGTLTLSSLAVDGTKYPKLPVVLAAGAPALTWGA